MAAFAAVCALANAWAGNTCTWTGAGADNLASTAENWSDATAPTTGDAIVLDGTSVKDMTWDLDVPLSSWTQAAGYSGTVTITTSAQDDNSFLNITGDVDLQGGTWTHAVNPSPTKKGYDTYRLKVKVGGAFTLGAAAQVDVSGKGLPAGKGLDDGGGERGGSHGGHGRANQSPCFGSVKRPYKCGAGGSANIGGGVFILEATGAATLDGAIHAHGSMSTSGTARAYGASGGAICVIASTISGTGTVEANGGNLYTPGYGYHSPAGGGRVALVQTAANSTYATLPTDVTAYSSYVCDAAGTYSDPKDHKAGAGTVYFEVASDLGRGKLIVRDRFTNAQSYSDFNATEFNAVMDQDLDFGEIEIAHGGAIKVCPGTSGTDFSNTVVSGDETGYLIVQTDLTLGANWTWKRINVWPFDNANVYGTVSTVVSNTVCYQSAATVPGNLTVVKDGLITHRKATSAANGYCVDLTIAGNLTVDDGGAIDVTRKGYENAGYGTDQYYVGSGHGGRGSPNSANKTTAAACYGDVREPITYGTRGNHAAAGGVTDGGGRIRLVVGGTATVNGLVASTASTGGGYQSPSAGSIQLTAAGLLGSGQITAIGAPSSAGSCSGGGRIAVTLTGANATVGDFDGDIVAFGRGNSTKETYICNPNPAKETRSGAGTIYVREKNAALDEGTLYVDQRRNDGKVNAYGITELCSSTTGRDYGAVVVTNGGILAINDAIDVTAWRWENRATMNVSDASVCHVKGDADGNAWLLGNPSFTTLVFDDSVKTVYLEAGGEVRVSKVMTLVGASDRVIRIRSTVPGTTAAMTVLEGASATVEYVDVKDCDATGGIRIDATHSTSDNAPGWNCINIEPGTTITWQGTSAGWANGANWDLDRVPVATDLIVIPAGCEAYPVLPAADTVLSNLTVAAGASLTLSGSALTVTGDAVISGALVATGSETLSFGGSVTLAAGTSFDPHTTTMSFAGDGAATLALAGKAFHKLVLARTGRTTVTGGTTAFETTVAAGSDLAFEQGKTLATTLFYVNGTPADPVRVASSQAGSSWGLVVSGYAVLADVQATDSDASAGSKIFAGGTSSGANCINWSFADTRYYWSGASSDDFANAANWLVQGEVPAVAPGAGDYVVVDASSAVKAPVVKAEQEVASLSVVSGDFRVNASLAVSGSVTVLGGATLTADKPIAIGGDCSFLAGATLTHTALPSTDNKSESYRCDITVGGDMSLQKGAFVNLRSKGYKQAKGPGAFWTGSYCYASHGGGTPIFNSSALSQHCYGSIFAPTNAGSGSCQNGTCYNESYVGGGAIVLNVIGKLTLDADLEARPYGYTGGYFGASGGSVYIRAGELVGSGNISAQGGWVGSGCTGGGGRIAVVLTKSGADFSGYKGAATAYAGSKGVSSSDLDTYSTDSANGTVYTKTADETLGTIFFENQKSTSTSAFTDLGYDAASSDLKGVSLKLGRNARVRIVSDVTVGDIESIDATAKLFLNGHTLKVKKPKNRAIHSLIGTRIVLDGGALEWQKGFAIIVR